MKKRIRKKLRIKEFYEPIVLVKGYFIKELNNEELDLHIDQMCDYSDKNLISFNGTTWSHKFHYYLFGNGKYKDRIRSNKLYDLIHFLENSEHIDYISWCVIASQEQEDRNLNLIEV